MNRKTIPALTTMVMLWPACAASGPQAVARQSVRLEVVPVVEAAVSPIPLNPADTEADPASTARFEWGDAALTVTPGSFHGKVTVPSEPGAVVEVSAEAMAEDGGRVTAVARVTLTDP